MKVYNLDHIRKNKLTTIKRIRKCAKVIFIAYIVFYAYHHYTDYNLDALKRTISYIKIAHTPKTEKEIIQYNTDSTATTYPFHANLVSIDKDYASFLNPGGIIDVDIPLNYQNPKASFGKNHALIYDLGAQSFVIANNFGILSNIDIGANIMDAFIDHRDNYAIVTDESGYISAVTVFNYKNEQLMKYSSSTYHMRSAKLHNDMLVVSAIGQDGLEFKSHLLAFNMRGQPIFESSFLAQFMIDFHIFDNGNIGVILEDSIVILDHKGRQITQITDIALQAYNLENKHNIVYAHNNFDDSFTLNIINNKGMIIAQTNIPAPIDGIYRTASNIYILSGNILYKYDNHFNLLEQVFVKAGVLDILAFQNNSIYAVYGDQIIRLFD